MKVNSFKTTPPLQLIQTHSLFVAICLINSLNKCEVIVSKPVLILCATSSILSRTFSEQFVYLARRAFLNT